MKRFLAYFLAISLLFLFSACNATGTTDTLTDKADGIMLENDGAKYAYAIQIESNVKLSLFLKTDYSVANSYLFTDETKKYFTESGFEGLSLEDAFKLIFDKTKAKKGTKFSIKVSEITSLAPSSATAETIKETVQMAFENQNENGYKLEVKEAIKDFSNTPKASPLDG